MSLSQRFERVDEKRRSGGQNSKTLGAKLDPFNNSSKGAKNGPKKTASGTKQHNSPKPSQKGAKKGNNAKKQGPKRTYSFAQLFEFNTPFTLSKRPC